jgi:hypothetical protein
LRPLCRLYGRSGKSAWRLDAPRHHVIGTTTIPRRRERGRNGWGERMLDIIFIVLGMAFFLGCVAYTLACDRL